MRRLQRTVWPPGSSQPGTSWETDGIEVVQQGPKRILKLKLMACTEHVIDVDLRRIMD